MKALLIDPPTLESVYGKIGKNIQPVAPSLGLLYIAAVAEQHGFEVSILDAYGDQLGLKEVSEQVDRARPDVVGVTSTTTTFGNAVRCLAQIKKENPQVITVLGGPHISAVPAETMKRYTDIDIGVVGEGEYSFLDILRQKPYDEIPGILFRRNGEIVSTPRGPYIADLDSLPFPARHLVDLHKYRHPIYDIYSDRMTTMITSRGCPYQCTFCGSQSIFGRKTRFRSVESIAAELDSLVLDFGIKGIHFRDDTFTLSRSRVYEICRLLKERKLVWTGNLRADKHIDKELLGTMKDSGCSLLLIGVESGDEAVLDFYKKGISLSHVRKIFRWANELRIDIHASFIFGSPMETKESIRKTVKLAKEINPDIATFFLLNPFPGSPIYDYMLDQGMMQKGLDWANMVSPKYFNPIIRHPNLTDQELKSLLQKAHLKFYFRPGYILRKLVRIDSVYKLKIYWQTFKNLVRLVF
jgi:radical SAM superfamily enzyme YgiQ (UPF0313 family)